MKLQSTELQIYVQITYKLHTKLRGNGVKNQRDAALPNLAIFSMKLSGFMSKAIKLLLTELVGQCSDILPIAFSALTSKKATGNIFLH